jgi:uncharacterized radical SAM protein YgiQ
MQTAKELFSYRPYWARRFGTAEFLPRSRQEMETLGWDSCDIILVTGDAYVDHPAFGTALIGRLLEAQGFRVAILAQPDWRKASAFTELGPPNLFFGVTAGNMDSLVNQYTSEKKPRSDDAYSANAQPGQRPSRACIVYSHRSRHAFPHIPIVIGGIEASLRRIAHYDYWSDQVRGSILIDSGADLLVYGNGERQVVEIAHRLASGQSIDSIKEIRGTARVVPRVLTGYQERDLTRPDRRSFVTAPAPDSSPMRQHDPEVIRIPSYEDVKTDPRLFALASRIAHLESNPYNERALIQRHGRKEVWINPPALPLSSDELDRVYELSYARKPHPSYGTARIPAFEMIANSITILRGCFGGCSFCSITAHEGRAIQSRSLNSILAEIERVRDRSPGFTGQITDLGGPTANMYRLGCRRETLEKACRRPSCLYPELCKNLNTNHEPLIELYRRARQLPEIKKIAIGSGVRYDLAVLSEPYVKELVSHHVGGYLKIAPEHISSAVLALMMKPGLNAYYQFKNLFDTYSHQSGKEQYLIPYFIAGHPGTRDRDMLELSLWLKKNNFRPDQVQLFLPSPMASATTMYYTGINPLEPIRDKSKPIPCAKTTGERRLHKAFLRWHDPDNWPLLRTALRRMGRTDLIGGKPGQLVPAAQPSGWRKNGGVGKRQPGKQRRSNAESRRSLDPHARKAE